jgi:hypothetical protein
MQTASSERMIMTTDKTRRKDEDRDASMRKEKGLLAAPEIKRLLSRKDAVALKVEEKDSNPRKGLKQWTAYYGT